MWSYVLKRLLLMIPTLLGILLITFVVIQFVPGGPVEQMVAQFQGFEAGGEGPAAAAGRLSRTAGGGRRARGGNQEALRLRQAPARALRPDDRPVRALRPRQELLPQQGRRRADPREAAGLDQPRPVDLPSRLSDLGTARHRQRRCAPARRSTRSPHSSCSSATRSQASSWASRCSCSSPAARSSSGFRCAGSLRRTGRDSASSERSSTTSGTSPCRSPRWCWAASP